MGSVHYTSPEQARGGFSEQRSDIYSIGITLFEMVTGQVPFDGETTVEVAMKHLQQEITPPSELVPDIPYSLEQIILKCTQKSVNRRYEKMEDVIADLKHSLIDPQGNFVKLSSVDNEAKTVVISDEELGEIKHTPKNRTSQRKQDVAELEDPSVNSADAQKNTADAGSADAASATATGAEIVNGVVVAKENDWVREGDFYKLRKKTAPESTASEAKAAETLKDVKASMRINYFDDDSLIQ